MFIYKRNSWNTVHQCTKLSTLYNWKYFEEVFIDRIKYIEVY